MNNPRVTISLITYNSQRFLEKSLPSITEQIEPVSITISDNDSSDNTVALVKELLPQAKLILSRQNLGFCVPHNKVISWCTSPYILILNPDVLLTSDYCQKLADYLDEHPNCAAASGALYRWHVEDDKPSQIEVDSCGLRLEKNGQVYDINSVPVEVENLVFGVSGAAVMYRVDHLKQVALLNQGKQMFFDENYYLYKEDVDLAFRLQLAGFSSVCLASTVGYHQRSLSGTINLKQRVEMEIKRSNFLASKSFANHYKTLYKNLTKTDLKQMYLSVILFFIFRLVTTTLLKPKVGFTVFFDLLKSYPVLRKQRRYIQSTLKKQISLSSWYNK